MKYTVILIQQWLNGAENSERESTKVSWTYMFHYIVLCTNKVVKVKEISQVLSISVRMIFVIIHRLGYQKVTVQWFPCMRISIQNKSIVNTTVNALTKSCCP